MAFFDRFEKISAFKTSLPCCADHFGRLSRDVGRYSPLVQPHRPATRVRPSYAASDKPFNAPSGDADQVFALQTSHATDCPPGSGRIAPHRTSPSTPLRRCRSAIRPSGAPRNGAPARLGHGHATLDRSFSVPCPFTVPASAHLPQPLRLSRSVPPTASPPGKPTVGQIGFAFPATGSGGCPCHPRHLAAGRLTAAAQALWSGETSPEPTA